MSENFSALTQESTHTNTFDINLVTRTFFRPALSFFYEVIIFPCLMTRQGIQMYK